MVVASSNSHDSLNSAIFIPLRTIEQWFHVLLCISRKSKVKISLLDYVFRWLLKVHLLCTYFFLGGSFYLKLNKPLYMAKLETYLRTQWEWDGLKFDIWVEYFYVGYQEHGLASCWVSTVPPVVLKKFKSIQSSKLIFGRSSSIFIVELHMQLSF